MADDALARGLDALGVPLDPDRRALLLRYRNELARWARVHNLTAVRDPAEMVPVHLLDSLALLPLVRGETLADIGSGGGLPGLPLAIAQPDWAVTLIEPRAKRALFLQHVARMLELPNVTVERARAEDAGPAAGFDTVMTRAFGTLAQLATVGAPLCRPGGCLLAAKGRDPRAEVAGLPAGWRSDVLPLAIPGVTGARHAVRMEPPRTAG